MKAEPEFIVAGERHCVAIHQLQKSGRLGEVLGRGVGQSTDFLDHRPYVPGDDIRRVDWNAFARTDQLLLKRYQEEIRPSIQLWIDDSASMRLTEAKHQLLANISSFFIQASQDLDLSVVLLQEGVVVPERILVGDWEANSVYSLGDSAKGNFNHLRSGSHVILLSDVLSVHEPSKMISAMLQKAVTITVVQILDQEDIRLPEEGILVLEDSETGELLEIEIDARGVEKYEENFRMIQQEWQENLRGRGNFIQWTTTDALSTQLMTLVQLGIIQAI